jgi:hypothetical protein
MALQGLSALQLLARWQPTTKQGNKSTLLGAEADSSLVVGILEVICPAAIDDPDADGSLDVGSSVSGFLFMVLVLATIICCQDYMYKVLEFI